MPVNTNISLVNEDGDDIFENICIDGDDVVLTVDEDTEIRVPKEQWGELNDAVQGLIDAADAE
jgi:hypothetical protein